MIIPPEKFRKYIKPRYAKIIQEVKKKTKDIKIAFHSDGYIEPIIPDFIEIGVDILNPMQPVNNLKMVKKIYGKNLVLWGGIDTQHILNTDYKRIIKEVREKLEILAPGGGYISGANSIEYCDRLFDNIFTYYWALYSYGKYKE